MMGSPKRGSNMNKARVRQVERILRKTQAEKPPDVKTIFYDSDESAVDAEVAALRESGFKGVIICLPKNGREVKT